MNWKVLLEQESELLIIIYLQAIKLSTICHQAVPAMINKRISNISCDKECFIKGSPDYKKALKSSEFNQKYQIHTTSFSFCGLIQFMAEDQHWQNIFSNIRRTLPKTL